MKKKKRNKRFNRKLTLIVLALLLLGFVAVWLTMMRNFTEDIKESHIAHSSLPGLADVANGDIIFQVSKSSQSKAIQEATHSKYSHMGIIYVKNDEAYVFEAIQPVKLTPLKDWIRRGEDGHYVIKRLSDADERLTTSVLEKMMDYGSQFMGRDYDLYFEWSDDKIYCSELVWKIYKEGAGIEIGQLQRLGDFDLSGAAVQAKIKERYGDEIPLEEAVISPSAMFESDKLELVLEH